jgi:hypothetical protein
VPIDLFQNSSNIVAGGNGSDGDLILKDGDGQNRIRLSADSANAYLGGNGADGDLVLFPPGGDNTTLAQATIHLDSGNGNVWLGGNGTDGDLVLFPTAGDDISDLSQATIHLDGQQANVFAGGNGADGDVVLRAEDGRDRIRLSAGGANAYLGGNGADGDILLFPSTGDNTTTSQATIRLDGESGDIILQNADAAEDFDVDDSEPVEPGTVMVIDEASTLRRCERGYDKCVAGVISGAGDLRPGVILGRKASQRNRLPVALIGKVMCKADAQFGSIAVGDLLTTSSTPGHAMKASDPAAAFGAVIGKALRPLREGRGLIPILVALQ